MRAPAGALELSGPDDIGIVRGTEIGIAGIDVDVVGHKTAQDGKFGAQRVAALEDIAQTAPIAPPACATGRPSGSLIDRHRNARMSMKIRLPYDDQRGLLVADEVVYRGAQYFRQFSDDLVALDAEPDDEMEDDGSEGTENAPCSS